MECCKCGICCLETEMLLSEQDIKRLTKKGYRKESFSRQEEGYIILRNQNGHCVFFNEKTKKCKIYKFRPMGCQLYPIIYDEAKGIVVDKLCASNKKWCENKKKSLGKKVKKLLKKIDIEAIQRTS
jgi:Fe-S-cluster containining protein